MSLGSGTACVTKLSVGPASKQDSSPLLGISVESIGKKIDSVLKGKPSKQNDAFVESYIVQVIVIGVFSIILYIFTQVVNRFFPLCYI